jgi:hypothetical protein
MDNIVKLLSQYSLIDILAILVMLCLAIKGGMSFFDWVAGRTRKAVYKSD